MSILIGVDCGMAWHVSGGISVKGYFFHDSVLYESDAAASFFVGIETRAEFREKVANLNGSFAVIILLGEQVLAAVDRLRSIPIFYSDSKDLVISDSARTVVDGIADATIDQDSQEEFLLAGYTIGDATLV